MENGPLILKLLPQLVHPYQVSVVDHRQGALHIFDGQGLGVLPLPGPGGGIAHMAHGHGPVQPLEGLLVKHLADQAHVLIKGLLPVIDGGDAASLLSPVLQGVQPVIGGLGTAPRRVIDAEHAALLVQAHVRPGPLQFRLCSVCHLRCSFPLRQKSATTPLSRRRCPYKILYYSSPPSCNKKPGRKPSDMRPGIAGSFCEIFTRREKGLPNGKILW